MVSLLLPVIYLAFISLGLPDSLLGSAWPVMYQELGTSVSAAGIISMIISAGTIVSSLNSDRLNTRFGTGKVTAVSVLTTAVALFGFSISHSFWALCLWGIPYGLGAGSVDAALNNYVALHYKARHMSWLHCMWGVGCSTGPVVMSWAISHLNWNKGYLIISIFQIVLTLVLFLSLPLWQKPAGAAEEDTSVPAERSFSSLIRVPGVKEVLICFFCYCAVESTAGMWAASYCTLFRGIDAQRAASWASLFYIGITIGRFICGFVTMKLNDQNMIRLGQFFIAVGAVLMLLPFGDSLLFIGLILIGLGCALLIKKRSAVRNVLGIDPVIQHIVYKHILRQFLTPCHLLPQHQRMLHVRKKKVKSIFSRIPYRHRTIQKLHQHSLFLTALF